MSQDPKAINALLRRSRHILVIKLRYVGDAVWALPFIENLKRNLPNARLSVLTIEGTESIFQHCPAVDQVVHFSRMKTNGGFSGLYRFLSFVRQLRKIEADTVIDLTDSDRSAIFSLVSGASTRLTYTFSKRWRTRCFTFVVKPPRDRHLAGSHLDFLREIGFTVYDEKIHIPVNYAARQSLLQKVPSLAESDGRRIVVIHPGARIGLRQWGEERYAKLADLLSQRCRIFLVAGPGEKEVLDEVARKMEALPEVCSTQFSIAEFIELCGMADIFIGNDSGPIHLAATRTYVVGIYGPNTADWAGPWSCDSFVFEDPAVACRPCQQSICTATTYKSCFINISPGSVAEKVLQILDDLDKKVRHMLE